MEIATTHEMASTALFVAIAGETVTETQRKAAAEAVAGDIDKMCDCFNGVLVAYNSLVYTGKLTATKAKRAVEAEYRLLGFSDIVPWADLAPVIELYYDRKSVRADAAAKMPTRIRTIFAQAKKCEVPRVRAALLIYCLRLLQHTGQVTRDIAFTTTVMDEINALSAEEKTAAILPPVLVTEL